jgi:hypothetical protein
MAGLGLGRDVYYLSSDPKQTQGHANVNRAAAICPSRLHPGLGSPTSPEWSSYGTCIIKCPPMSFLDMGHQHRGFDRSGITHKEMWVETCIVYYPIGPPVAPIDLGLLRAQRQECDQTDDLSNPRVGKLLDLTRRPSNQDRQATMYSMQVHKPTRPCLCYTHPTQICSGETHSCPIPRRVY